MNSSLTSTNSSMRYPCPVYLHMHLFVSQCKFPHPETQEMLKLIVLQHAVWCHKARDWIWLQDQSQPTCKALLTHCQLFEACCKQYQKAKEKGWADITSITAVTTTASSIHTDALSTFPWCTKCGYFHPLTNVWLWNKSAIHVAAGITTPPCDNAKRPRDHPTRTEAQRDVADCPETTGPGTTKTTGAHPADPPADACTATHQAIAPPTVPLPTSLTDPIVNAPPSNTTRIA